MGSDELERVWVDRFAGVAGAMAEWRRENPRATLTEIEDALDGWMAPMRRQMLEEAVLTSPAAAFAGALGTSRPKCPECGERLLSRGAWERRLLTTRGQEICLRRSYAHCPACGSELFPPR